ncbi:MAG TPA: hypothetical protein VFY38_03625 [Pseudonocardia sp.]|nr:hypothetical protein [Pseudonocardia sp.]
MTVHWGSLLAVFLVSLGSAVAVVALVATALWGLSARVPVADAAAASRLARRAGMAVAVACLAAAALVVLFGFWVIIVR